MIGDHLYQLTPRDEATELLGLVARRSGASAAAVDVSAIAFTTPSNRCFWLYRLVVLFLPGAGQILSYGEVYLINGANLTQYLTNRTTTSDQPLVLLDKPLLLGPGDQIVVRGTFNAGANANTVNADCYGYEIARGQLLRSG